MTVSIEIFRSQGEPKAIKMEPEIPIGASLVFEKKLSDSGMINQHNITKRKLINREGKVSDQKQKSSEAVFQFFRNLAHSQKANDRPIASEHRNVKNSKFQK